MIKKSLITLAIILAIHALATRYLHIKPRAQYTFQENLMKAEHFLHESIDEPIIVGSSQSNRLVMDSLPGVVNLSFAGCGVFDGLAIVNARDQAPKVLLIEKTFIFRPPNEHLINAATDVVLRSVKDYVPSLRSENQPMVLLGGVVMPKQAEMNFNDKLDTVVYEERMKIELQTFWNVPSEEAMEAAFRKLQDELAVLEAHGTKIIFFEMPLDRRLCDSPLMIAVRTGFEHYFPEKKYTYIPHDNCERYQTSDGIHLLPGQASRYSQFIRHELQSVLHVIPAAKHATAGHS